MQDRKIVTPGKAARQSPRKLPDKSMPRQGKKERYQEKVHYLGSEVRVKLKTLEGKIRKESNRKPK